jgi:cardiolipin synthase
VNGLARLLGLRRGGEEQPETRAGQPLRPVTLPNLIGGIRLGLLVVFLVIALPSGDGRVTSATICFVAAAAMDYLDGLTARITGQYSRLGTLMDPLVDRALVLAAALVDWKFELLPRWALAALAGRELFMLLVALVGLAKGLDIHVNWLGRLAVWPTMAAVGGALMTEGALVEVLLYVGLAGGIMATALYVKDGLRELRFVHE